MKPLKITIAEDWHSVQKDLNRIAQQNGNTLGLAKAMKNVDIKIKELCDIDMALRRHPNTVWLNQQRLDKITEINATINIYSKVLVISALSKR